MPRLQRADFIHKTCSRCIRTFQQRVSLKTEQETQNNVLMNVHKSGNKTKSSDDHTNTLWRKKIILQLFGFSGEFGATKWRIQDFNYKAGCVNLLLWPFFAETA